MDAQRQLAKLLLQIKAIKLNPQNPFTWASGRRSPIYCDNRVVLSHPEVRSYVAGELVRLSQAFGALDGIAAVATAGIPHGTLLADRLELPLVYVRAKAKEHGRQNLIEGELLPGGRYLMVEDLISTGGSSLQAVEALRDAGAEVAGVLALFTYGFPEAQAAFDAADCPLATLSNYPVLLQEAAAQQYIQTDELDVLAQWAVNPAAWSDSYSTNP